MTVSSIVRHAKALCRFLTTALVVATAQGWHAVASAQIEVLDQVVAIVDDDIILASELQERVQGVKSTMEARGVDIPEDEILVRETLDRLILDSIQLQLANLYGVRIPDQQLDESMTRLAGQNGLTLEQFRLALEQSGQSYAAAREGLAINTILGDELQAVLKYANEQRNSVAEVQQKVLELLPAARGRGLVWDAGSSSIAVI